ncbi:ABC transporter substrate-binding protein [Paenibacillus sp. NPDC058071]|uniref:ABC transporter substrate-binding protein n=1 Tax=Paenibacillus sp. NPDC058071 TaxID=3346326 RepID=UPI0036D8A6C7
MQALRKKYVLMGVVLALVVTVLSACGGESKGETKGEAKEEKKAETRIVSTINGDVEIPAEPKRIVALYYHHLLFAFDMKPVGANLTWWGGSPFLKDLESDGIIDVGGPPSLEKVAELDPDLIIMNSNNTEDYDQFAKIAPSVLIPYNPDNSAYDDAKLLADILGKPDAGEQLLTRFEEKAKAAREKLHQKVDENAKVAIIRIEGKGSQFSIFGYNYGRGGWSVYKGLNLKMPARIEKELNDQKAQFVPQLSIELLPEYVADADYILVSNEGEGMDAITNSETWKTISAVKNNKAIELDGKQYFYFDPISIEAQLDLITNLLLENS